MLPPEIIGHIFSFLQSDFTILARCSQVHPILSPHAERLLYADIVVFDETRHYPSDCRKFSATKLHKLLTKSPHIANYIRKLEIHLCLLLSGGSADEIAPILPMLSQLRSISVTSDVKGHYWPNLSARFRDTFINCLSSSNSVLKEVAINSLYDFPLHVLDGCETVKTISLCGTAKYHENNLQVMPHPILDSLSLHRWWHYMDSTFLAWARKHIHSLRSLSLGSNGIDVLPELVRVCSNSLRDLDWYITGELRKF